MPKRHWVLFKAILLFWGLACSDISACDDLFSHRQTHRGHQNPVLAPTEIDSPRPSARTGDYHTRLAWGRLCFYHSVTVATERSGSLIFNRGAEITQSVIRLEPNQGHITSRSDRRSIEWLPRTTVTGDGIAVGIVIGQSEPVLDASFTIDVSPDHSPVTTTFLNSAYLVSDPVEIEFETGLYSSTFTATEISALDVTKVTGSNPGRRSQENY